MIPDARVRVLVVEAEGEPGRWRFGPRTFLHLWGARSTPV